VIWILTGAALLLSCPQQGGQDPSTEYAIVVSDATASDAAWAGVIEALREKRRARVVRYGPAMEGARAELARMSPRYVCFVCRAEEAGREFVVSAHRITRMLDDDPYTDALWGILTGYDAGDALKIARTREPLRIERAGAGCGLDLNLFKQGQWFSECEKNLSWRKDAGEEPRKIACPDDTTRDLVALLNKDRPQFFMTSGHATHRDWQIGFSYRNGEFRCRNGQLFGLATDGTRHDVDSPSPKVYCAAGNCLMGWIEDRETMAPAWMRSAGVRQLVGYVVSTWYGYGGWGVNHYFLEQAGRFTFAESFFLNQQALLHRLETEFPEAARLAIDRWDLETDSALLDRFARRHGIAEKDALGLLWDRDTVAFYGDPAWEARVVPDLDLGWKQALSDEDGKLIFSLTTLRAGSWRRPPAALFGRSIPGLSVLEGEEFHPLVTDDFLLVPRTGDFQAGEEIRVVVGRAEKASPSAEE